MNFYYRTLPLTLLLLFCFYPLTVTGQNLKSSLIARYKLDGNLKDERGVSDGGFAVGNIKSDTLNHFIDGYDGTMQGALLFGGAPDSWYRVDLGDFSPVQQGTTGEMTVAFWAYWNGPTGSWQDIINKRDEWSSDGMVWGINQHAATDHMLSLRQPNSEADSDVSIPEGVWTHVAVSADGENAYFFINGELKDTEPYTYGTKYSSEIHAGTSPNGEVDAYNGALDDIGFYSRVLTEAEVKAVMYPGTPLAKFRYSPDTVLVNETIALDASGSYDSDGEIVSYQWDFGNGDTATGITVDYVYSSPGEYSVELMVTDNDGNSTTTSENIIVYSGVPIPEFTYSPRFPNENEKIEFDGSESWDPDGTVESYRWNFGDGESGTGSLSTHSYSKAGDYHVTLSLTDNEGKTDSMTKTLTVYEGPEPVRILPLGNSITSSDSSQYSYRYTLWKKLVDGGYHFDFIGSLDTNFGGNPEWPTYQGDQFDPDHEGHWGYTSEQVDNNLADWLAGYSSSPDIVLIHIGTNDLLSQNVSYDEIIENIKSIITRLREDNPDVDVVLSQIIPSEAVEAEKIEKLNEMIPQIKADMYAHNSRIIVVDQYTGFDPQTDLANQHIPSASGENKIASRCYQGITTLFQHRALETPRIIATTDGEYDDQCSMIRFLLYTNEWDVEGIVYSSSKFHWVGHNWAGTQWIQEDIDLYAQVYDRLLQHDPDYPTPDYLHSKVFVGNIDDVGEMEKVTPGSDLIVDVLLDSEPGPVWLQAWGGTNTIARALKTIQEDHPDKMDEVSEKAVIYIILDQDKTYENYIKPNWPDIPVLYSRDQFRAIAYSWSDIIPQPYHSYFERDWMVENITSNHGPLCSNYPSEDFGSEGDTPAFLYNIPVGLRQMEHPAYGGWGGRFHLPDPTSSQWWGAEDDGNVYKPLFRWGDAYQKDFAARADWCISEYSEANHRPIVRVNGTLDREVDPGSQVTLSATGTSDPDGDNLSYRWQQYGDADGLNTDITINRASSRDSATFIVPNAPGKDIHVILEVTDDGAPQLTSYQRFIFKITGETGNNDESFKGLPDKFDLGNNFPNPFNAETKINYSLPQSVHVNLAIFDIRGRRVAKLVDENQQSGRYEVRYSPKNLASGLYIYRLRAGSFSETRRMVFIK